MMTAPRKLVRIALELEESDVQEMQQLIDGYNAQFAPLKLNRTELIRSAVREKMAQLRVQLKRISQM
jgi:hypothetical protein